MFEARKTYYLITVEVNDLMFSTYTLQIDHYLKIDIKFSNISKFEKNKISRQYNFFIEQKTYNISNIRKKYVFF